MVKAILFDVDGVLLDSFESNLAFYQKLMPAAGYKPPTQEEFAPYFHFPMWDAIKVFTGLNDDGKIREIWELGRDGDFRVEPPKVPDEAEKVVALLTKEYPLGVVTSRVKPYIFEEPLEKLKPYFKIAVGYEDTENHKPHPEPLLFAAKKLGVLPEECVYIGDVENDIQAARAAGMKVIIYSKNCFDKADACTSLFINLPGLISSLRPINADDVIWVDENDGELGIISREKAHREGLLHRIAVTYLTKKSGEILIQERMSGRPLSGQ